MSKRSYELARRLELGAVALEAFANSPIKVRHGSIACSRMFGFAM